MHLPYVLVSCAKAETADSVIRLLIGQVRFVQFRRNPPIGGCFQLKEGDVEYVCEMGDEGPSGEKPYVDLTKTAPQDAVLEILDHVTKDFPNLKGDDIEAEHPATAKDVPMYVMAKNFGKAMAKFAGSGFLRATAEQHAERMVECNACEFWDPKARLGLGKCAKCGCTGAKQWIASSECPIGKWGPVAAEKTVEATEEEREERLSVCRTCEFWNQAAFGGGGRCSKCGCSTQLKLKRASESCPIGKWGPIEHAEKID